MSQKEGEIVEMTQHEIALETLKAKHFNGGVESIHEQVFFKLGQDKCPVCDVSAMMWLQKRSIAMDVNYKMMQLASFDKISNGHTKPYNPKDAPEPTEVTCKCGRTEMISDSNVNGPDYCRIDTTNYECPLCFITSQGL